MAKKRARPPRRTGVPLLIYVPRALKNRLRRARDLIAERLPPEVPARLRAALSVSEVVRTLLERGLEELETQRATSPRSTRRKTR